MFHYCFVFEQIRVHFARITLFRIPTRTITCIMVLRRTCFARKSVGRISSININCWFRAHSAKSWASTRICCSLSVNVARKCTVSVPNPVWICSSRLHPTQWPRKSMSKNCKRFAKSWRTSKNRMWLNRSPKRLPLKQMRSNHANATLRIHDEFWFQSNDFQMMFSIAECFHRATKTPFYGTKLLAGRRQNHEFISSIELIILSIFIGFIKLISLKHLEHEWFELCSILVLDDFFLPLVFTFLDLFFLYHFNHKLLIIVLRILSNLLHSTISRCC